MMRLRVASSTASSAVPSVFQDSTAAAFSMERHLGKSGGAQVASFQRCKTYGNFKEQHQSGGGGGRFGFGAEGPRRISLRAAHFGYSELPCILPGHRVPCIAGLLATQEAPPGPDESLNELPTEWDRPT
jgi:hypothetical protein